MITDEARTKLSQAILELHRLLHEAADLPEAVREKRWQALEQTTQEAASLIGTVCPLCGKRTMDTFQALGLEGVCPRCNSQITLIDNIRTDPTNE